MRKKVTIMLIVLMVATLAMGCAVHNHKVGNGAQGSDSQSARQWYILWGLVPLNAVDSNQMAGNVADYDINTQMSFIDFLIGIPAGWVTINCRTVTVNK